MTTRQTPYYLYDTDLLDETLASLCREVNKYKNYHVHYAIKANANPLVLERIVKAGLGVDCVSGWEVEAAINAGFHPSKIVFAGVGKNDNEIRLALHNDIFCFNVESIPELEVINDIANRMNKRAAVCLRINPDVGAHTHANITTGLAENKFGIALADTLDVIRQAQSMENILLRGLHFHIGSQILEMDDFQALALRINEIQDMLEANGITLEVINVGGGLGVDYENPNVHPIPDFQKYFATFHDNLRQRPYNQIHFELGRAIVAQCGSLITRVLYVKQGTERKFAIVDAGMTELIRPALYGALHKIENITASQTPNLTPALPFAMPEGVETYDVVGPICESSDTFAVGYKLPTVHQGDILAIRSAGAYGEAMASNYNLRPLPRSYTTREIEQ